MQTNKRTITIDTGELTILINNDETRFFCFNPNDILFAEKFYRLIGEFEAKEKEFDQAVEDIEINTEVDENGIPVSAAERIQLVKEVCLFAYEQIDLLFGEGTSKVVFGNALVIDAIKQFFEGITPYFNAARQKKVAAYTNTQKPTQAGKKRRK